MRDNPLQPFPKSFHGPPAWGGTEGGVHTADTLAQAVAYANVKGEPPDDYPVVLALDTTGLEPLPDLDVKRAAEYVQDALGGFDNAVDVIEDIDYYPSDHTHFEAGDSTQNWLFAVTEPSSLRNFYPAFQRYLEDIDEDRRQDVFERARAGQLTDAEKMSIWGQARYLTPIDVDRVVAVYQVNPFWPVILPAWDDFDDETEFYRLEAENPGYAFIFADEEDMADPASAARLVWERGQRPPFVEYHGTSWRNLAAAFPDLAARLPTPPAPYAGGKP